MGQGWKSLKTQLHRLVHVIRQVKPTTKSGEWEMVPDGIPSKLEPNRRPNRQNDQKDDRRRLRWADQDR
jgi:hypothetical protein